MLCRRKHLGPAQTSLIGGPNSQSSSSYSLAVTVPGLDPPSSQGPFWRRWDLQHQLQKLRFGIKLFLETQDLGPAVVPEFPSMAITWDHESPGWLLCPKLCFPNWHIPLSVPALGFCSLAFPHLPTVSRTGARLEPFFDGHGLASYRETAQVSSPLPAASTMLTVSPVPQIVLCQSFWNSECLTKYCLVQDLKLPSIFLCIYGGWGTCIISFTSSQ